MMRRLEMLLEERKKRRVNRIRTTERKIPMNHVRRGARRQKEIVPTTRSNEAGKARILIHKSGVDPLKSVEKARRRRRNRRREEILKQSPRRRRNRRRAHCLREEVDDEGHHATEFRPGRLRKSRSRRIKDTRKNVRRRILRKIIQKTEGVRGRRIRRSGRRVKGK